MPSPEIARNPDMLYIAVGILGATVMPHNLYLHSSIVQTRKYRDTVESRREGLRIARVRFDAGITSALDYRQAESLLTQAETELAGLRLTSARAENALRVLVGGPVTGPLPDPLPLAQQASAVALVAGLPS